MHGGVVIVEDRVVVEDDDGDEMAVGVGNIRGTRFFANSVKKGENIATIIVNVPVMTATNTALLLVSNFCKLKLGLSFAIVDIPTSNRRRQCKLGLCSSHLFFGHRSRRLQFLRRWR